MGWKGFYELHLYKAQMDTFFLDVYIFFSKFSQKILGRHNQNFKISNAASSNQIQLNVDIHYINNANIM